MGTAMVTTDIAVDAAIITVGAEGVVIITDGTEAVFTVTGKPLLEGSVRDAPRFDDRCVKRPEGAKRRPLRLSEFRCQGFAPVLSSKIHKPAAG